MKRKNESGVLIVEAAIVVTVVIMFIAVMLYIGMILYQQSIVNIMANQTASNLAQTYGNTLRDPFTGYIDAENIQETVTYANIRNQAYMEVIEQKADAVAVYRLKSSKILTTGKTEVEVEIVPKSNEVLKDQLVVSVKDSYEIPFISFFGADNNKLVFKGTGRADCVDLLEYMTGVPVLGTTDGNAVAFSDECTVNFYKHYGDTRPLKTVTVLRGNSINASTEYSHSTMPNNPSQDKMRFTKWMTADGRTFTGNTIVNDDMSVYGDWSCVVTFDPDGGSVSPTTMTATVTGDIVLPKATRENCTFAGWYTKKNGEGVQFNGTNIEGDITVYAKWTCTVSFDSDKGTVSPDSIVVVYGKTLQQAGIAMPTPTRDQCTFANWWTARYGEGTQFTSGTPVKGHCTVIAKWTCNVSFKSADGKKDVLPSKNVVAGKDLTLEQPTRNHDGDKGWQFDSWKDEVGNVYVSYARVERNMVFYEQWHCNHVYVYDSTIVEATCEADGKCIHKCKYCGSEIEKVIKNFGGHEEGEGQVVSPGCESEGIIEYYCTKCDAYLREVRFEAKGHDKTGHCGVKHTFSSQWWEKTDKHRAEGHFVSWASCIVCKRCGVITSYAVLCGTHCEKWKIKNGWGNYTYVNVHGKENELKEYE